MFGEQEWTRHSHPLSGKAPHVYTSAQHGPTLNCEEPPKLRGAPVDHVVDVREVRLSAGAEFVVLVCGTIMTMPGLPESPAATAIDVTADGQITGLF